MQNTKSMQKKPKEKIVKAWVILYKGNWNHQISTQMSVGLRKFYNQTKDFECIRAEIHYKLT